MSLLKNPEMDEVILDFTQEADKIYSKIEQILEEYEDDPSFDKLEQFGQTIDRVMGAAKSIGADKTGLYCELGKTISYKASQSDDDQLGEIVVAILFDMVELLKSMNKNILIDKEERVDGINIDTFATRLHWLANKFQDIKRSSVAIEEENITTDQRTIDDLLKDLDL